MDDVRSCSSAENQTVLAIINAAATKYKGVIPADHWHEPYMSGAELERELASGITFWGIEAHGKLAGVMGHQCVHDVELIRHAYVLPEHQGNGIGGRLMHFFLERRRLPMLVGTWAAAEWAIRFYQRHGFTLFPKEQIPALLRKYWNIPNSQVESSVVLKYGKLA